MDKPTSPEAQEAQLREQGMQLARELSEVTYQEVYEEKHKNLRSEVNPKMKKLMDIIIELEGKKVRKQIGDHVVDFEAANPATPQSIDNRFHLIQLLETNEDGDEISRISGIIDGRDGGSTLMTRDLEEGNDDEYTNDTQMQEDLTNIKHPHPNDFIVINRLREMRLVARLAQLMLDPEKM